MTDVTRAAMVAALSVAWREAVARGDREAAAALFVLYVRAVFPLPGP